MDSNMEKEFASGNILKLLIKLSIPTIAAQIINALYNIVDRVYIGHIKGIGTLALTGVGITFPIIIIISAFAAMVGMGGAPLASIKMGKGEKEEAEKILGNAVTLLIIFGIFTTVFFLAFKHKILYMFGASDTTFIYADKYIGIYVLGSISVMFSLGLNPFINSQGFTKVGMLTVTTGAIANIILAPIFIFVFGMGVEGSAVATVISQSIAAIWALSFLCSKKTTLRIKRENLKLNRIYISSICALGLSPFIMQTTESLLQIVYNKTLLSYGNDIYVGVMTVMGSLMQIITMPLIGLCQGAQPIVGYNYGSKNFKRVRTAIKYLIITCTTYGLITWVITMSAPETLIKIFNSNPELIATGKGAIRIFFSMLFVMSLQISAQQSFIALGQAKFSISFALLRKIVLLIPLILILPRSMGVNGAFWAEPISDTIAAATTFSVFIWFIRKNLRYEDEVIEDKTIRG